MTMEACADYEATDEKLCVRCPCPVTACKMATLIRVVKHQRDSVGAYTTASCACVCHCDNVLLLAGGVLTCMCTGIPAGWGEPCFDKLEAQLALAMMSLPATKGFDIGSGFAGTRMRGSQHNDPYVCRCA